MNNEYEFSNIRIRRVYLFFTLHQTFALDCILIHTKYLQIFFDVPPQRIGPNANQLVTRTQLLRQTHIPRLIVNTLTAIVVDIGDLRLSFQWRYQIFLNVCNKCNSKLQYFLLERNSKYIYIYIVSCIAVVRAYEKVRNGEISQATA